jgi:periplasmic divalent cation tolerance protein
MSNITWVLINCKNVKEADEIGRALLKKRLIACFDIIPERKTSCFWPPLTGKIESGKGSMFFGVTLPSKYKQIIPLVRRLHSDKVPFVGSLKIDNVNQDYYNWLKRELKK